MAKMQTRPWDAAEYLNTEEDVVAYIDAALDDGSRVPHAVALAIMGGERPVLAFRRHHGMTLRDLAARTGIAAGYLSEIERDLKPGSAAALGTTIDVLVQLD